MLITFLHNMFLLLSVFFLIAFKSACVFIRHHLNDILLRICVASIHIEALA